MTTTALPEAVVIRHTLPGIPCCHPMVQTPALDPADSRRFRSLLEATYRRRSLVHLVAGSSVPLLRHQLWLVVRGMVKLGSLTVHGDELLLGLAGPDQAFGEPLHDLPTYTATTLCSTDLLCLSWQEIQEDHQLAVAVLQMVSQRQRQSQALLALLGLRRVEERLRGFLELLALDYGQPCEGGLRLDLGMTHQELASALGTTRVTVTRMLGQLRQEGWLETEGQRRLVLLSQSRPPQRRRP